MTISNFKVERMLWGRRNSNSGRLKRDKEREKGLEEAKGNLRSRNLTIPIRYPKVRDWIKPLLTHFSVEVANCLDH